MKILHYTHNLGSGGAEKLLSDILPILKSNGHEIHLAISNDKKNVKNFQERLQNAQIPIINFDTSFYNPVQVLYLIKIMKKEDYDIVHAHLFPTQYWLAFASLFVSRHIVFIKTEHSDSNRRRRNKILNPLEKFVYSRYKSIIGITSKVTENLKAWLKLKQEIITIPNGVNLVQIREARTNLDDDKYSFLDRNKYNILMVGRFDGVYKDQMSLIKSLEFLPEDVFIYLAGEGPALESFKQKTEELGFLNRVTFLGLRTDVYTLMNLVDLNVLSTNTEGLSGVTLESLASGKPFIGSDVGGVNNIVPDNSFLFPKRNPKALAQKILHVRNDFTFRNELVEKAQKHVEDYDITIMVNKYLEVYENRVMISKKGA